MTQPLGTVLRYTRLEPPKRRLAQAVEDAKVLFARRLGPVERAIAGTGYATAGRFTVADISIGYALFFAMRLGLSNMLSPDIVLYAARLEERPAFCRATAGDTRPLRHDGSLR